MKNILIILISLLSINAFGQSGEFHLPEFTGNERHMPIYRIYKSDTVLYNQALKEINSIPNISADIDTVMFDQSILWGFRTETYYDSSDHSHSDFRFSDTLKFVPHSILWGYN